MDGVPVAVTGPVRGQQRLEPPHRSDDPVSKTEAEQILASPEIGGAISRTVMRRGHGETNDEYHWENDADASDAQVQQQCPTCGRWASMTSSHRCPVPGSEAVDEGMNDLATQAM
ncbi:hypothetical protein DEU38_112113 [Rhodococcus sp. AG1013]|nr:hypothetical protein DEU38_112113 [Rhodococcus sp. AG1013]